MPSGAACAGRGIVLGECKPSSTMLKNPLSRWWRGYGIMTSRDDPQISARNPRHESSLLGTMGGQGGGGIGRGVGGGRGDE